MMAWPHQEGLLVLHVLPEQMQLLALVWLLGLRQLQLRLRLFYYWPQLGRFVYCRRRSGAFLVLVELCSSLSGDAGAPPPRILGCSETCEQRRRRQIRLDWRTDERAGRDDDAWQVESSAEAR